MATRRRLKKGDISLQEVWDMSREYYRIHDDKKDRVKRDLKTARITGRRNYSYDRSNRKWVVDDKKTSVRFEFLVRSQPVSYPRIDSIKHHYYPVTFLIFDIEKGLSSSFRWRTGSEQKVKIPKKGAKKKKRIEITETNIKNGRQLDFFYRLEALLDMFGLLYGVNTTNGKLPKNKKANDEGSSKNRSSNPDLDIYFDKTALFVFQNIIRPFLSDPENVKMVKNRLFKNNV